MFLWTHLIVSATFSKNWAFCSKNVFHLDSNKFWIMSSSWIFLYFNVFCMVLASVVYSTVVTEGDNTLRYKFCSCSLKLWTYFFSEKHTLKGQCHEIFCFWFFFMNQFPPAPEYPIRTVLNFFENSQRYSQVKVCHRYQRHRWQICHRCQQHCVNDTGGKFATGINDTGGKLPPLSTTPVAICLRYQRHRWQIMGTISGCWNRKVNLKAKMYL